MVFDAIPFPFEALVFMLPKGSVHHPTDGDCPFLALSRTTKGRALSLPIPDLDFSVKAQQNAVVLTTYMPEAKFNVTYYKSVLLIPGATIKQAFQQSCASSLAALYRDVSNLPEPKRSELQADLREYTRRLIDVV